MSSAFRLLPVAAALLMTTAACASGGYSRYPVGGRPTIRQVDDRAYRNGYSEGRVQGEDDMRRGRNYDVRRHGEYRNADDGYGGYGNRNEYRQMFRQGFEAGYSDGYRTYSGGSRYPAYDPRYPTDPGYPTDPRYPTSGPPIYERGGRAVYRTPAADNGFRDGLEQGQRDARDRRPFDPVRASRYREGDRGYNSRYGSRDVYKQDYRNAFQQGYDQGYRQWRR